MHKPTSTLALFVSMLASCSFIVDAVECEDNTDCVLEDGTQLVCTPDNVCISAPAQGDECTRPSECLDPLVCVAPDAEQDVGLCALDCTDAPCEGTDQPDDSTCCELDNGMFVCLPAELCATQ